MEMMDRIQRITGAQAALGLSLYSEESTLPDNCSIIGCTDSVQFCRIEGYLDTVFAVRREGAFAPMPIAYCMQDFICLILSCGCAQAAAEGIVLRSKREKLEKLARVLKLKPMADPLGYLKTVHQVIDYRRIPMNVAS